MMISVDLNKRLCEYYERENELSEYCAKTRLDNVTLDECSELCKFRNVSTVINDGKIVNFVKERD